MPLKAAGVPIIGTSPESIDLAEDRKRFGKLLEELDIPQPPGATAASVEEALANANRIGYPVLVRPSYVLGGRAMVIAYDDDSINRYMKEAVEYSQERPVLIDHFLESATEVDVDALSDGEDVVIGGIMQHIEEAGIHSGDSSCVLPSVDLSPDVLATIRDYTFRLARALKVIGLMNIQYAIQRDKVFVIEVNPRASRTVPYVSKATGVPLAKIAARLMTGRKLRDFLPENVERATDLDTGNCFYVKSPVFPWGKFPGVDTVLGPEMKSTGEVMGVADNFGEAFAKAQAAAGQVLPDLRPRLHQRQRSRQALHRRSRQEVRRTRIQPRRHSRHRQAHRRRRPAGRARLQSQRRTPQRRRSHQGRPHSARHQHAARPRSLLRREGDSPRRRDRAHPDHHHALRRPRRLRRHRRPAAWRRQGLRFTAAPRRSCNCGKVGEQVLVCHDEPAAAGEASALKLETRN